MLGTNVMYQYDISKILYVFLTMRNIHYVNIRFKHI